MARRSAVSVNVRWIERSHPQRSEQPPRLSLNGGRSNRSLNAKTVTITPLITASTRGDAKPVRLRGPLLGANGIVGDRNHALSIVPRRIGAARDHAKRHDLRDQWFLLAGAVDSGAARRGVGQHE